MKIFKGIGMALMAASVIFWGSIFFGFFYLVFKAILGV